MNAIETKLNALMTKIGNKERRMNQVEAVEGREKRECAEKGLAHEGPYQVKEAQYVAEGRSYQFKLNPNLPQHSTPALRNRENFSYGGGAMQGQRPVQNMQNQCPLPRFQDQHHIHGGQRTGYQGQRRNKSFEDQMLQYMGENKRLLNIHEKKFTEIAAFQSNT